MNHRNSAFGGSSISLAILAAWTLVHLHTQVLPGEHRVVIRRCEMDYSAPIVGAFRARCDSPGHEAWDRFGETLRRRGRAQISLAATVNSDGVTAGSFTATYAALPKGDTARG